MSYFSKFQQTIDIFHFTLKHDSKNNHRLHDFASNSQQPKIKDTFNLTEADQFCGKRRQRGKTALQTEMRILCQKMFRSLTPRNKHASDNPSLPVTDTAEITALQTEIRISCPKLQTLAHRRQKMGTGATKPEVPTAERRRVPSCPQKFQIPRTASPAPLDQHKSKPITCPPNTRNQKKDFV